MFKVSIVSEVSTVVFNKEQYYDQLLSINMTNVKLVKLKIMFKFKIIHFAICMYLYGYLTVYYIYI